MRSLIFIFDFFILLSGEEARAEMRWQRVPRCGRSKTSAYRILTATEIVEAAELKITIEAGETTETGRRQKLANSRKRQTVET